MKLFITSKFRLRDRAFWTSYFPWNRFLWTVVYWNLGLANWYNPCNCWNAGKHVPV